MPEWAACCGSDIDWDLVDAELEFQHSVDVEHGVVYGEGDMDSLEALLNAHIEVGYDLCPGLTVTDTTDEPVGDHQCPCQGPPLGAGAENTHATGDEGLNGPALLEQQVLRMVAFLSAFQESEEETASEGCRSPTGQPARGCVLAGPARAGRRELRRKKAVVSAPIVSKVVADMRAEIGMCCLSCNHANIDAVRADCPANYQAAQWTALRIMKDRRLHKEHIQLYLIPCLVAYFSQIHFADGLGGYQGRLGVATRRTWRQRHRAI